MLWDADRRYLGRAADACIPNAPHAFCSPIVLRITLGTFTLHACLLAQQVMDFGLEGIRHGAAGQSVCLSIYTANDPILRSHASLIPHLHSMPNLAPVFLSYKKWLRVLINLDYFFYQFLFFNIFFEQPIPIKYIGILPIYQKSKYFRLSQILL